MQATSTHRLLCFAGLDFYPPSMCSNYQDPVKFCSVPHGMTSFVTYCFLFPKLMFKLGVSDRDYQLPSGFHFAISPLGKGTSHPSSLAVDTMKTPCGRVEPCANCAKRSNELLCLLKGNADCDIPVSLLIRASGRLNLPWKGQGHLRWQNNA